MSSTRLSTKGQVVIPRAVRERRHWQPGQRLEVVETEDGVLLRPELPEEPLFPPTTLEDIGQVLNYQGPPVPVEKLGIEALRYADLYPEDDA